jgi:hypothetical protein
LAWPVAGPGAQGAFSRSGGVPGRLRWAWRRFCLGPVPSVPLGPEKRIHGPLCCLPEWHAMAGLGRSFILQDGAPVPEKDTTGKYDGALGAEATASA